MSSQVVKTVCSCVLLIFVSSLARAQDSCASVAESLFETTWQEQVEKFDDRDEEGNFVVTDAQVEALKGYLTESIEVLFPEIHASMVSNVGPTKIHRATAKNKVSLFTNYTWFDFYQNGTIVLRNFTVSEDAKRTFLAVISENKGALTVSDLQGVLGDSIINMVGGKDDTQVLVSKPRSVTVGGLHFSVLDLDFLLRDKTLFRISFTHSSDAPQLNRNTFAFFQQADRARGSFDTTDLTLCGRSIPFRSFAK